MSLFSILFSHPLSRGLCKYVIRLYISAFEIVYTLHSTTIDNLSPVSMSILKLRHTFFQWSLIQPFSGYVSYVLFTRCYKTEHKANINIVFCKYLDSRISRETEIGSGRNQIISQYNV